jgi:DNA-binding MarR family transcriptional regulator
MQHLSPLLQRPNLSNPIVALIDEVVRINGRLKTIFEGVTTATGLSSMEITVLTAVVESPVAPTVPQIGRSLGHSRQVIQRAANVLIAAEFIETAPNPHHKRAPLLLATTRGEILKRETDTRATAAMRKLSRSIDAVKCRRVAGQLRELRGEMEAYLRSEKAK